MKSSVRLCLAFTFALASAAFPAPAQAQDQLCDPGEAYPAEFAPFRDCRAVLLDRIKNETVAIDVAFWFMEDARYTAALIERFNAGVPVRVLMDPRANSTYPLNASRLNELQTAGIPMRKRLTSYILHWKMMTFHGQGVVQFSGANYSADAWRPATDVDYQNYTDEAIYFTDDTPIVQSFMSKFDDYWTNTIEWANYANITTPLLRMNDPFPKDSQLNFPPAENFRTRSIAAYKAERRKIDVIMFRITDRQHTDNILAAVARGIPVRLITEPEQYRLVSRMWHAWNVDRLFMGGVQIKHRAHAGLNHQKSVILYDQNATTTGDQTMTIFGSSNWTSPSATGQVEHNMFTSRPYITSWLIDQFERKWNNTGGLVENVDFVPLPPDAPKNPVPATGSTGVGTTVTLKWFGGPWAHLYDLYLDTNPNPTTLVAGNLAETSSKTATSTFSYALPIALQAGTTYYWKVVGKTMALQAKSSPVWTFTTAGSAPPPPPSGSAEVVLYASKAPVKVGAWRTESDASAAGAAKIRHPDAGAAKITTASASPVNYFEMTFYAEAGRGYRLWIRGRADNNYWGNDSVFVQFTDSVTSSGAASWRIGTTSAAEVNLEDCSGCGLSGWGWQDNGWGTNVLGPLIYFPSNGTRTIRVQTREDGFAIDQIVLSHTAYATTSPGALKNDTKILAESDGSGSSGSGGGTSAGEIVLHAADGPILAGAWAVEPDLTAAGGARVRHPNAGAAKLTAALASPVDYFEVTFNAESGKPYRLWLRGRADGNSWANDSVFVQFSGAVDQNGSPTWRIGTASATEVNLEDCSGCGLSGWGWQDNGWGVNVLGPLAHFDVTGEQTIRIQTREDGLSIDQIVLSSADYLNSAPGALKDDDTVLAKTQ
jgi:phosphatidylserine/phosphatidylglycerophosphate/cardiolipin synthase-like enzyme